MFAGQTVDLTTGMHCTPCALVTENKTPAANLHRKTRLLAKCRSRAERAYSALETATRMKGELSRAGGVGSEY